MPLKLTKKQQNVLDYIQRAIEEQGVAPSYRDIAAGLGLSSVSAVAEHVDHLVALGALRRQPGEARSLEVVDTTHPETVELFHAKMATAPEEDLEILRKAAKILDIDI